MAILHYYTSELRKLNLFDGIKSIDELEDRINCQWHKSDDYSFRGYAWESFTEAYLTVVRKCEEVYPGDSVPRKLRKVLKLTGKDLGVDGVFKENGRWFGYQCKYRGSRDSIQYDEVATFFASAEHCAGRFVITNSFGIGKNCEHIERVSTVGHAEFKKLTPLDFKNIWNWMNGEQPIVLPILPKTHQLKGVKLAKAHFLKESRGQFHYACATGKTLTSMFVAKEIGARRMVVFVPSLQLATQFRDDWFWTNDQFVSDLKFVFVASDDQVAERSGISYPITTDPKELIRIIKGLEKRNEKYLIISTYQSSAVTCAALKGMKPLDFGIYDEAHTTVGHREKMFAYPLFDKNIRIDKRLFMTATPRMIKARNGTEREIASMDDDKVYGKVIDAITFKAAREMKLITPVKLVVIVIDKNLDREEIKKSVTYVKGEALRSDMAACQIGLKRALKKIRAPRYKIITFHNRNKGAADFINYGLEEFLPNLDFYGTINSEMTMADRQSLLEEFREAQNGVVSNCRCLGIGTNVKSINVGMFVDPKQSTIDIIQNLGRIMRLCDDYKKDYGYAVVPLLVERNNGESLEDCISKSTYKTLIHMLEAMISMDETIQDQLEYEGKSIGIDSKKIRGVLRRVIGDVKFIGPKLSVDLMKRSIDAMVVDKFVDNWDVMYGKLSEYITMYGEPPKKNNRGLGCWLFTQRKSFHRGTLSSDRTSKLRHIGISLEKKFSHLDYKQVYKMAKSYYEENGELTNIPTKNSRYPDLQKHMVRIRTRRKNGELSNGEIKMYDSIGMVWNKSDSVWESSYEKALEIFKEVGYVFIERNNKDVKLVEWSRRNQSQAANNKLSDERRKKLDKIGFVYDSREWKWQRKMNALRAYKKRHGNISIPQKYVTKDGIRLGVFLYNLSYTMKNHKKSHPNWYRQELEIGITPISKSNVNGRITNGFQERVFAKRISELKDYKKEHGHVNVPQKYENSSLAWFVTRCRRKNKLGTLNEKVKQILDDLGFEW